MSTTIEWIKFYTILETAEVLKVTPITVRNYIKKGRLRAQRIGRPYFITATSLREFLTAPERNPKR